MKLVEHPNIIKLIDFSDNAYYSTPTCCSKKVSFLALELAEEGSLVDFITTYGPFHEKLARFYFSQLIQTLDHIHSQGCWHLDIKPDNILFDSEYNLKLWDFGFSSDVKYHWTKKGTLSYLAPEIFCQEKYWGPVTDIFSAGIILFIMVTGHLPFCKPDATDHRYRLFIDNKTEKFWEVVSKRKEAPNINYSADFKDLINQMLSPFPWNRPSLSEVMSHSWFWGEIASLKEIQEELNDF